MGRNEMLRLLILLFLVAPFTVRADQYGDLTYSTDGTNATITGYTGPSVAVVIPSSINGYSVVTIGNGAFDVFLGNGSPTSVTVPDSVTNIEGDMFDENYTLTNINIGAGVVNIETPLFTFCPYVEAITVSPLNSAYSSVAGVLFEDGQSTLIEYPDGNQAGSYTIPNSVTNIASSAFASCGSLTNVVIPNSVSNIGGSAFYFCTSLTSVTISNGVATIGARAFENCSRLNNITLPNSVTNIGWAAFEATGLGNVTIPNSVANIQTATFDICENLTNITIPNSVTNISNLAFYNCGTLTTITIPNSVAAIGDSAFSHCFALSSVFFQGNTPSADSTAFQYDTNIVYYLPETTGEMSLE
jgi:BspA type Leucine rich repeat region (6 copies)